VKVWMARTSGGQFLCENNINGGLSYHLAFPYDARYLMDTFVFRNTRWEIGEDCAKWNLECRKKYRDVLANLKAKPVLVNITWEEVGGATLRT